MAQDVNPSIQVDTVDNRESLLDGEELKNVLKLIEVEIDDLRNTQTRQGWTLWALLGSLATSLWLLSSELSTKTVSARKVGIAALCFSFLIDLIRYVYHLINPNLKREGYSALPSQFLLGRHLEFFGAAIRQSALFVLCVILVFGNPGVGTLLLWYIIFTSQGWAVVCMSLAKDPEPLADRLTRSQWQFLFFAIPTILYFAFGIPSLGLTMGEIRSGGLVAIVGLIGVALCNISTESPAIASLVEIRRDLSFGKITVSQAVERIEKAVTGVQVRELVEQNVEGARAALTDLADITAQAYAEICKIEELVLRNVSERRRSVDPELVTHLENCYEILDRNGKSAHARVVKHFYRLRILGQKLRIAGTSEHMVALYPLFTDFDTMHRRYLATLQRFQYDLREIQKTTPIRELQNLKLREAMNAKPITSHDLELTLSEYVMANPNGPHQS